MRCPEISLCNTISISTLSLQLFLILSFFFFFFFLSHFLSILFISNYSKAWILLLIVFFFSFATFFSAISLSLPLSLSLSLSLSLIKMFLSHHVYFLARISSKRDFISNLQISFFHPAKSAGAVEYTDCISVDKLAPPHQTNVLDMTQNNLMVRLQ